MENQMTDLTSAQLTTLTAILLGQEPARAANRDKAMSRLIAVAVGHGLRGIGKIVQLPFAEAKMKVEVHVAKTIADSSERPRDDAEQAMVAQAEAQTKAKRRRPVVPAAAPAKLPAASGKAWFRQGEQAEARMLAVMIEVGPAKLAAFRAKFAEGQDRADEFEALSQTQQNGILIRAMDKLMGAGRLTRNGLIYNVRAGSAKAQ
jgi:hypothetical protein